MLACSPVLASHSATCVNLLKLPDYQDPKNLREKLICACAPSASSLTPHSSLSSRRRDQLGRRLRPFLKPSLMPYSHPLHLPFHACCNIDRFAVSALEAVGSSVAASGATSRGSRGQTVLSRAWLSFPGFMLCQLSLLSPLLPSSLLSGLYASLGAAESLGRGKRARVEADNVPCRRGRHLSTRGHLYLV